MKDSRTPFISIISVFLGSLQVFAQTPEQIDTLSASVIIADDDRTILSGLTVLEGKALRSCVSTFGVSDVIKTLKTLPGVAAGMELTSGLYVHGGDGSDNLFLLDGVPLFQVAHLGGVFSSFNTESIQSLEFYQSGFPPRYGGRMSSVVDITTKNGGPQLHGAANLGILDGQVSVGGPLFRDDLTYFVSVRRSWPELFIGPVQSIRNSKGDEKTKSSYYLYDVNVNLAWTPGTADAVYLRLYRGKDVFHYYNGLLKKYYGKEIYLRENYKRIDLDWGNLAVSTEWVHQFSKNAPFRLLAYYSRGASDIGYKTKDYRINSEETLDETTYSGQDRGDVSQLGIEARQSVYLNHHRLGFGAVFQLTNYLNPDSNDVSGSFSIFAEDKYTYGPWSILAGIRWDLYKFGDGIFSLPQPRMVVGFTPGPYLTLNATYSRMSQFSHLLTSVFLDLPTNRWAPSSKYLPPANADQVTIGWKTHPTTHLSIGGELYYKTMENLVMYSNGFTLFPPADNAYGDYACGKGRAFGMGLEGKFKTSHTETDIYYTLSWSQRLFSELYPYWFYDRNDNRHKLTIKHLWKISKKVDLDLSWEYHSGNRITLPEQVLIDNEGKTKLMHSTPNNMQMPAWHRMDMGIRIHQKTKRGHEGTWSLGITNVYCRKNPLLLLVSNDENNHEHYFLQGFSFPPFIPSVSYMISF